MSNPEILTHRANVLKSMLLRAGELKDEESLLHDRMDPVVASVNRDKKLVLLDELSQTVHHPDLSIVEEVAYGFDLVGWMPKTGLFEAKVNPMAMLPETLDLMSGDVSKRALDRVMTSSESNLEGELYEVTKDEVKKGWLIEEIPIRELPADAITRSEAEGYR